MEPKVSPRLLTNSPYISELHVLIFHRFRRESYEGDEGAILFLLSLETFALIIAVEQFSLHFSSPGSGMTDCVPGD